MQEDKNLNKQSDHSRFMPPGMSKESLQEVVNTKDEMSTLNMDNTDINISTEYPIINKLELEVTHQEELPTLIGLPTDLLNPAPTDRDQSSQISTPYQSYENYIPGYNTPIARQETNNLGTTGFILSLITIILFWIPIVGWILWLLGAILSIIGLFKKPKGLAIAGTIISGFMLIVIIYILSNIDTFLDSLFTLFFLKYFLGQ
ncbi:DUF4190 domain-containing protein [Myroides sp. M-43]|uniref:DUF4190 domain-containing protein n=1 Tax=Myroides oncorhynchi TaxID=2893756 RepID=UPI001E50C963|nr:DUF4190 domain-containing protein [Myroides oncorhynchi]MCC9041969.1 DUF4190 domain-containing protein [Myroides oncorhynchi]